MEPEIIRRNRVAFEEFVIQEAQKQIKESKVKKILSRSAGYARGLVIVPAIASGLGAIDGGLEGAIDSATQAAVTMTPIIGLAALGDLLKYKIKPRHINELIETQSKEFSKMLILAESNKLFAFSSAFIVFTGTLGYVGASYLMEKITGMDISQMLMAQAALIHNLTLAGIAHYQAAQFQNKFLTFAQEKQEETDKIRGERIQPKDLEDIAYYALKNPDTVYKIFMASKEKLPNMPGALGFISLLDGLNDKLRDPARVKPEITLDVGKTESWGKGSKYMEFKFEKEREKNKKDLILDLAKTISTINSDFELEIHPMFDEAPLDEMLTKPHEQLSSVEFKGKKDNKEFFKVKYDFSKYAEDKIEIEIYSKEYLPLLLDVFNEVYRRPAEDRDFDREIIENAKQYAENKKEEDPLIASIKKGQLGFNGREQEEDPLYSRSKMLQEIEAKKVQEELEQPLEELDDLPKLVLKSYEEHKEKIMPVPGYDTISIAFKGLLYVLTPMEYNKKEKKIRKIISVFSPIKSLKSLITNKEVLPSLREAQVTAQIEGITKENILDVLKYLDKKIKNSTVKPKTGRMNYDEFWQMASKPELLEEKAYSFEVTDDQKTKITISFSKPKTSYAKIRKEQFPTQERLKEQIREIKQARENKEYGRLGIFGLLDGHTRPEKLLKNQTYANIEANEDAPEHTIIYNGDENTDFFRQRTILISTRDGIFIDNPVHPKEAIQRITKYMNLIREAVKQNETKNLNYSR